MDVSNNRQRAEPPPEHSSRPAGYSGYPFALQNAMPLMMVAGCYGRVLIPMGHRFGKLDRRALAMTLPLARWTGPFNS